MTIDRTYTAKFKTQLFITTQLGCLIDSFQNPNTVTETRKLTFSATAANKSTESANAYLYMSSIDDI